MDHESITFKGPDGAETIRARTRIWAAGVQASPLAKMLAEQSGAETDRAGRIVVNPDCTMPGRPEVFAIGDMVVAEQAARGRAAGAAGGQVRRQGHPGPADRRGGQALQVLRQGLHGDHRLQARGRRRLRRAGDWLDRVPHVGVHPRAVPRRLGQPASARCTRGRAPCCSPRAVRTGSSPTVVQQGPPKGASVHRSAGGDPRGASRPDDLALPPRSRPCRLPQPRRLRRRVWVRDWSGEGVRRAHRVRRQGDAGRAPRTGARLEDVGRRRQRVRPHVRHPARAASTADGPATAAIRSPRWPPWRAVRPAGRADRGHEHAWLHPALLLRGFAQLAMLVGGDRVTAGPGPAGARGVRGARARPCAQFRTRMTGWRRCSRSRAPSGREAGEFDGDHVVAHDLPRRPVTTTRPACSSAAVPTGCWGWPGASSDVLDLHGDPKHGRVAGATMTEAAAGDVRRRAPDHGRPISPPGSSSCARPRRRAGRPRDAVGVCDADLVCRVRVDRPRACSREERWPRDWGGHPDRPLDRSPYLLFGAPAQMAEALLSGQEAYGLEPDLAQEEGGIATAPPDPVRFCREVVPLLG